MDQDSNGPSTAQVTVSIVSQNSRDTHTYTVVERARNRASEDGEQELLPSLRYSFIIANDLSVQLQKALIWKSSGMKKERSCHMTCK